MRVYYSIADSPLGTLLLGATDSGLAIVHFGTDFPKGRFAKAEWVPDHAQLRSAEMQLNEYFARTRTDFDLPLEMHGTEFQVRCWRELMQIPYGETISYTELAQRVGSPQGFRAVGSANGDNPLAIVVPCHRVVSADLTLGGYGGGLEAKKFLLTLEGAWPLKHTTASLFG